MNTETTIRQADIARHWDVSKPYVSQLASKKGMPSFRNLAEADAWRALNAPPKPALEANRSSSDASQSREKNRVLSQPQQPTKSKGTATSDSDGASTADAGDVVDIAPFIARSGDFDTNMVKDAEEMPLIARGLFDRECKRMNVAGIANFLKIWAAASSQASEARQRFLDIKERTRALIAMDDVEDVLGTELQALRSAMLRLGARCASRANPSDPALAQSAVDAAVDEMWLQLETGMVNAKRELVEGKLSTETNDTANVSTPSAGAAEAAASDLAS